jgi:outer membrane protein TolC
MRRSWLATQQSRPSSKTRCQAWTRNDALARRSFEVGQISLPELLLVRSELVDARLEYLNRLLEVAEAAIEQDAAAGDSMNIT